MGGGYRLAEDEYNEGPRSISLGIVTLLPIGDQLEDGAQSLQVQPIPKVLHQEGLF